MGTDSCSYLATYICDKSDRERDGTTGSENNSWTLKSGDDYGFIFTRSSKYEAGRDAEIGKFVLMLCQMRKSRKEEKEMWKKVP